MFALRWRDLSADDGILDALDHAGPRPADDAGQNAKRAWSERFADGCAVAFGVALRATALGSRTIRPMSLSDGVEPLTPLGGLTRKRIDVTVVDAMMGLEIGVSLKGLNFRDATSGTYDKNLTGRLYELADEVRVVHEHLPHAFMAAVLFLPLEATCDKGEGAPSSFANAVRRLRDRTGRLDAALAGQAARCDAGFVGLYAEGRSAAAPRGVARFLDVGRPPPRRGRPLVAETLALAEVAQRIADAAMRRDAVNWADAEPED